MIDEHDVREMLHRRANAVSAVPADPTKALRKAHRRLVTNGAVALVAVVVIGMSTVAGLDAIRSAPVPADRPSEELGIFTPAADRIVFRNRDEVGDHGYDQGLWAIDPSGPSDTVAGRAVAAEVASTLIGLGPDGMTPLGWSHDGTELLFKRSSDDLFPEEYLFVLHADGSETQVTTDPMYFAEHSAGISPDGARVVFAAQGDDMGLYVVDAAGGLPALLPSSGDFQGAPTFSPDGTRIAYVVAGDDPDRDEQRVWVADANGENAHEILADEPAFLGGISGLQWAPEGDRLAIGVSGDDGDTIYTFAPDGSAFTEVIDGGVSPYWSPDGTRIAYTIVCEERPTTSCPEGSILRSRYDADPDRFGGRSAGLAIADADGSNIREFGFAVSGPWHPGVPSSEEAMG